MGREFSYFRGIIGGNDTDILQDPTAGMAGGTNRGSLLTINAQYMRKVKGTAPTPLNFFTASFSHPADTSTGTSWQLSGTVTVSGVGASTGRWLWLIRQVTGFQSDFQMNDFDFGVAVGGDADGNIPNTGAALNAVFEGTAYDANFVDSTTSSVPLIKAEYDSRAFTQITTGTTSSIWNTLNTTPASTGTGIDDSGNTFVYYESSGAGLSAGKNSMLRTEEMTYTASPTCSFSYAMYSTTVANAGEVQMYWVES